MFTDYYKKLSIDLNTTSEMFGLGERNGDFWLKDGTYSLWSYNQRATKENGRAPGKNLQGVHPVLFNRMPGSDDTLFMAIFSLNSNAQDFIIKNQPDNYATITEITTGGTGRGSGSNWASGRAVSEVETDIDAYCEGVLRTRGWTQSTQLNRVV